MSPRSSSFNDTVRKYPGNQTEQEWFAHLPEPTQENNTSLIAVRDALITDAQAKIARVQQSIAAVFDVFSAGPNALPSKNNKLEEAECDELPIEYTQLIAIYERILRGDTLDFDNLFQKYYLESTLRSPTMNALMGWEEISRRLEQNIPGTNMRQVDRVSKLVRGAHLSATLTLEGDPFFFDGTLRCVGKSYDEIMRLCKAEGCELLPYPGYNRLGSTDDKSYEHRGIEQTTGFGIQPALPKQPPEGAPLRYGCYVMAATNTSKTVPYFDEYGQLKKTDRTVGLPNVGALCIAPLRDLEKAK